MLNYFIGKTQAQLETALASAQADLLAGSAVMQAAAGDASTQLRIEYDTKNRIELILAALNALDPVTYPAAQTKRVSRTKVQIYPSYDNIVS